MAACFPGQGPYLLHVSQGRAHLLHVFQGRAHLLHVFQGRAHRLVLTRAHGRILALTGIPRTLTGIHKHFTAPVTDSRPPRSVSDSQVPQASNKRTRSSVYYVLPSKRHGPRARGRYLGCIYRLTGLQIHSLPPLWGGGTAPKIR